MFWQHQHKMKIRKKSDPSHSCTYSKLALKWAILKLLKNMNDFISLIISIRLGFFFFFFLYVKTAIHSWGLLRPYNSGNAGGANVQKAGDTAPGWGWSCWDCAWDTRVEAAERKWWAEPGSRPAGATWPARTSTVACGCCARCAWTLSAPSATASPRWSPAPRPVSVPWPDRARWCHSSPRRCTASCLWAIAPTSSGPFRTRRSACK